MKVQVKEGVRYCYHGLTRTHADKPFEVTSEKADELVARGIVDIVDAAPATAEPEATDYTALSIAELRKECKARGIAYTAKDSKAKLISKLHA